METETAQALVPNPQQSVQLFGTNSPGGIIVKAKEVSKELSNIVDTCKLYTMISQRKHVRVEGWTTMLAMLGVFPHTEYSRRTSDEPLTYESRVVLKTIDGQEVGAGEAICSAKEKNWNGRDEYAVKSMSQTRAVGKAARLSFAWIMALAGYDPLPAEEITEEMREKARSVATPKEKVIDAEVAEESSGETPGAISKKQQGLLWFRLHSKFGQGKEADAKCSAWLKTKLAVDFDGKTIEQLTWKDMDPLLAAIERINASPA